jgi:hypothetical protein
LIISVARKLIKVENPPASTAARGLRPMLNHIDELLSKLTLSGLRRWTQFGTQAYRRDYNNLIAYFNLESADSKSVLQKERRGILVIDTHFNQHFNDEAKSRLAGMKGGLSTRMLAAMRHAGQHLLKQPEHRKFLLLVTDGEQADIDER